MSVPFCKDCRFRIEFAEFIGSRGYRCGRLAQKSVTLDPVTGKETRTWRGAPSCQTARSASGENACGPEGLHFDEGPALGLVDIFGRLSG